MVTTFFIVASVPVIAVAIGMVYGIKRDVEHRPGYDLIH